jgi:NitT/TauT family transport system ATP-binding protein
MSEPIIQLKNVKKCFTKAEHQDLVVLEDVNFSLNQGEIVAILGKSGSGKSTLLRIIAGLIQPTAGEVLYRGKTVNGPVDGVAMVFQSFALLPWLTVLQNVELGLEAQGIAPEERRQRALKVIDIIGLDGFESAFPKELSGGMRQRVGFARALVVNPDLLLMDEAFSALDVLTADNLKSDLLDLWETKQTNTNGILFVTHNIEEAVMLSDRIIIFNSDPGTIRAELQVKIPHPRYAQSDDFRHLVEQIYGLMTSRGRAEKPGYMQAQRLKTLDISYRLPDVDISELTGLIETLHESEHHDRMDLPELADYLNLNVDDLFPITEVIEILGFAQVRNTDIILTPAGKQFAIADILARKTIFVQHLLHNIPLAGHIVQILESRRNKSATLARFLNELEDYLSEDEAERVLRVLIEWGRYAEIFAYNDNTEMLSLEWDG